MGHAFKDSGKYQKALQSFNKALELDPNNVEAWYNKGRVLEDIGKDQEALKCFNKALELDPDFELNYTYFNGL